ncbi:MAG: patatin-like phospholipase family protein [Chloroflexi bacterium]|nr:patatin-like phospholipase family protein [Chloroflexota bacterium]
MLAVVLSGGGNRGAIEAGALVALFERGIQPQMFVGTSAGALNATFMALNPTLDGARLLAQTWGKVKQKDVFPGNGLTYLWRFITGADSLASNANLRRFIEARLPRGVSTFGDIKGARLYITTANLNTAELFLFGDDPGASLVYAVLCSAAAPPFLPPIALNGWQFSDGAVVANVPVSVAVSKGATEVYAIDVGIGGLRRQEIHGVVDIVRRAVGVMEHQQLTDDLDDVWKGGDVTLHYLPIHTLADIGDFNHAKQFVAEGYRVMNDFLDGKPPVLPTIQAKPSTAPPGATHWVRRGRKRDERGVGSRE